MKRVLNPVLSLFLVMAFMVNTAGITVYNHFCLEEGESTLSFTKDENCCADKHPAKNKIAKHACCEKKNASAISKIKKPGCCSQDAFTAQWKLNEFSAKKNILFNIPFVSIPVLLPEFKSILFSTNIIWEKTDPPFLLSSADILHLHSVLII